jgi:hypothetical protein
MRSNAMQSNIHQTAKWCKEFMAKKRVDVAICSSSKKFLESGNFLEINNTTGIFQFQELVVFMTTLQSS